MTVRFGRRVHSSHSIVVMALSWQLLLLKDRLLGHFLILILSGFVAFSEIHERS